MSESPVYVGNCPVCSDGLCKIRICRDQIGPLPIALCDECEAFWFSPDISQPPRFLEAETGRVGEFACSAWDDNAHWATSEEVAKMGWERALQWAITTESLKSPPNSSP